MTLDGLVDWIAATPLSVAIGEHAWVTPAVQTLHILAICIIMASVLMTDLRALGALGRDEPLAGFAARYGPWIWSALLVLALSGSMLIIGEPRRSLENPVFLLKMGLLSAAILATLGIFAPLRADADYWGAGGRVVALRGLAATSLAVWTAIIFAGRWIAYVAT